MNTQMSLNAFPPSNSAGPMLQLRLTAAAQPRNVSVNVPTSSAKYFFMSVIFVNIELCRNNNADSAPLLQYVNIKKKEISALILLSRTLP